MNFETVLSWISIPSILSSPWIRGAPQVGLDLAISRISLRVPGATCGRPGLRLDLILQRSLNPLRCHRITVSGLTRISALFQSCHILERITQKIRSRVRIAGRLVCRLRMASCWRRARFSTARCRSSARMSIRKGKISVSMVPGSVRPSVSTVNNVKQDEQTLGAGEAQRGSGPDVPRIKEAGQGPAFGV